MQTIHLSHGKPSSSGLTSAFFGEHLSNISYNSRILPEHSAPFYNHDVQIRSTLKFSSRRTSPNKSLNPSYNNDTEINCSNSPGNRSTTVSDLHIHRPYIPPYQTNSKQNPLFNTTGHEDLPTLQYGSMSNHFLWNSNIFCSQTHPLGDSLSSYTTVVDGLFGKKLHENKCSNDSNSKNNLHSSLVIHDIEKNECGNDVIMNNEKQNSQNYSPKKDTDVFFSKQISKKRNPYSIEELLKKPDKKGCFIESFNLHEDFSFQNDRLIESKHGSNNTHKFKNTERNQISVEICDIAG